LAGAAGTSSQQAFTLSSALAALHWIAQGQGYELTVLDVREAHQLALAAADATGQRDHAQASVDQMLSTDRQSAVKVREMLGLGPSQTDQPIN
jgi:hypothetical protein